MKKIITIALCLVAVVAMAQQPRRVQAYPGPIEAIQPNGDTLIIRKHGDERLHWTTTDDGFLLQENKKGFYCYAKEKRDGTVIATRRIAHNAETRTKCEKCYLKRKGITR